MDSAPLDYAPENEQGVVFLFAHLARRRFGLRVEKVQQGFPDCIAYRGTKKVRIEFEYRSSNFARHGHDSAKCDWVVCWIHDWPEKPKRLRVVELRREYGLGFNVWVVPIGKGPDGTDYREVLDGLTYARRWSLPRQASQDDLILFYRTRPEAFIKDAFRIVGPVGHLAAAWREGRDYMGPIRRVATLKSPIYLRELRNDPILKNAGFVRGNVQSRYRVSEFWPELYWMILRRNPSLRKSLGTFAPDRLS